ncbi:MAG: XdhC family protein [Bacteroidota bacterium]
MQDILPQIRERLQQSQELAMATVVRTWRSAPRPVGSALVVNGEGDMIGSVSGGCVEKSVVNRALKVLGGGASELVHYGVSNDDAWEVGLSCGGKVDVFIERFLGSGSEGEQDLWQQLDQDIANNRGVVLAREVGSGERRFALVYADGTTAGDLPSTVKTEAIKALEARESQILDGAEGQWFLQAFPEKPQMLLIGSAHITSELIHLASLYGFATHVIDPRDTFATKTDYPTEPDSLTVAWPQEVLPGLALNANTYAVILSHDPKIDDEALKILLREPVGYIGALGSKKTHAKRVARLTEAGFSDEELARIYAPIGLPINARLPQEIALSVMAEIIKVKNEVTA